MSRKIVQRKQALVHDCSETSVPRAIPSPDGSGSQLVHAGLHLEEVGETTRGRGLRR